MSTYLQYIELIHNPSSQPIDKAVIWLHGLGASGDDFAQCVPYLNLPDTLAVRFIFPHAPSAPVTINGGYVMPSWYDIIERSLDRRVDTNQIQQSSNWIDELIEEQIAKGVPADHIIIAGFSQGGAVAYHNALAGNRDLAGLIALSTYFATKDTATPKNTTLPIRIDHGSYDEVVPMILGKQACKHLTTLGFSPTFTQYPMAHQVSMAQLADIGGWISEVFDKKNSL